MQSPELEQLFNNQDHVRDVAAGETIFEEGDPTGAMYVVLEGAVDLSIDDEVFDEEGAGEKRGNLEARVLGDGKVLWKASDARAGQPALRVGPLDVSGVKQLVLEVDFGKELMMLDRADWVDPILVRK